MKHVNDLCFRGIYNGGLWEEDLHYYVHMLYLNIPPPRRRSSVCLSVATYVDFHACHRLLICGAICHRRAGPCHCLQQIMHGNIHRKDTPATCILFRSDKFTPLSATISIHFSLWLLFFGTDYQLISSRFQILTRSHSDQSHPSINKHTVFILIFNSSY